MAPSLCRFVGHIVFHALGDTRWRQHKHSGIGGVVRSDLLIKCKKKQTYKKNLIGFEKSDCTTVGGMRGNSQSHLQLGLRLLEHSNYPRGLKVCSYQCESF